MKTPIIVIMTLVAAELQVTFLAGLRPWGVVPNLLLVMVVLAAVYVETSSALIIALIGGLITDLASGSDFGLRMGAYGLAVLVITTIRRGGLDLRRFDLMVLVIVAASLAFDALIIMSLRLVNSSARLQMAAVGWRLVVGAGLAFVTLALVWPVVRRVGGGDHVRPGVVL